MALPDERLAFGTRAWLVLLAACLVVLVWFGQRFSLGINEYYFHKAHVARLGLLDFALIAVSTYLLLVALTARWRIFPGARHPSS